MKQNAWNVYVGHRRIDTVFFVPSMDADEVKRSLVDHDGYPGGIVVRKEAARQIIESA